ncbi:MAG: coproporphyrinogen-III oxidase family protein, partial [Candidatus Latescibacterota bacterium]|nr:coproporphyrinogen-III oxidase family protein [Candidatus Latescibacterota bacterium]
QLDPVHLGRILSTVNDVCGIASDAEITIEANPGSVDKQKFKALLEVGFNRLSIGVQSFNAQTLNRLGRVHSVEDAVDAFEHARECGFENVNIDLMFSIPNVSERDWQDSLRTGIELGPEHISTYGLIFEEGTPFTSLRDSGRMIEVDEDLDAFQYEWIRREMLKAGYLHYEVSNFSKPGYLCRHNSVYWCDKPYIGVGLSSHSYYYPQRWWNTCNLESYMDRIEHGSNVVEGEEVLSNQTALRDRFWLGLRTHQGVRLTAREQLLLSNHLRYKDIEGSGRWGIENGFLRISPDSFVLADSLAVEATEILEYD